VSAGEGNMEQQKVKKEDLVQECCELLNVYDDDLKRF
jgi:hypothetical protein